MNDKKTNSFSIRAIFHTPKGHKKLLPTDSGEFLPSREIFSPYVMSDSHTKQNRLKRVEMVLQYILHTTIGNTVIVPTM